MMEHRSTRASSDSESDASRTQRQAVGGAPQARSGVERVNQRGKEGGASMVVRSSDETPCSVEKFSPVFHNNYNRCGTSVEDSLLE